MSKLTISGRPPMASRCNDDFSIIDASDGWFQLTTKARWLRQNSKTDSLQQDEVWFYGTYDECCRFMAEHADKPSDTTNEPGESIRFRDYALYPVLSDDGQRMWASQPEPVATATDVVFDSDLALIERINSQLATLQADCERWSAMYAKQADEFVRLKEIAQLLLDENKARDKAQHDIGNAFTDFRVALTAKLGLANCGTSVLLEAVQKQADELVAVKAERDEANCRCSVWATKAGEYKGRLERSELAGCVDGWKQRAEAAEARVKELEGQIDANVAAVIAKHRSRADLGMQKYGVATANSDLTKKQWLLHLQEELMDAAVYVEAALAKS